MSWTLNNRERERFDHILERVLEELPQQIRVLLEESPLVVDDAPSDELLREVGLDPQVDDLCGLHTGAALNERSVTQSGELPDHIQLFRRGTIDAAGGWEQGTDESGDSCGGEGAIAREIRITILHEIGHHFGLTESDLERLGYD